MRDNKTFFLGIIGLLIMVIACSSDRSETVVKPLSQMEKNANSRYLNHHDSVKYIGMDKCKACHTQNHKTFIHTGMGSSFGKANPNKSSAKFNKHSVLFDKDLNLHYKPIWKDSVMVLHEYRLGKSNKDTMYSRFQTIDYIVGSGQHTNSHMVNSQGYLTQAPFTYYTQDGHLDFPPGFENGNNTRFSRKIGLECMSCHNGLPDFVLGSSNKYNKVPEGIDCERCHGPGELHVQQFRNGESVDTSKFIDYTIVNPSKLSPELQFDLCSRCHLQGNMVLKEGKNFYDFKPGMELTEVLDVFLPKYTDSDDKFIMASHVDRLKMSECFTNSEDLTCITCHNPHISVKETASSVFDKQCKSCHEKSLEKGCKLPEKEIENKTCFSCHMPRSGSSDIPHVRITDHKIGVHLKENKKEETASEFLNLYCVNNENPDTLTLIKAYLQQYERFELLDVLLVKAEELINTQPLTLPIFEQMVHLNFLRNKHEANVSLVKQMPQGWDTELNQSFDNKHGWLLYRLAEAYSSQNNIPQAKKMYKKALELAPYQLDFRYSYANKLMSWQDLSEAQYQFYQVLNENPNYEKVYTPLAYSYALQQNYAKAESLYKQGISLKPDDYHARCNLAGLFVMKGNVKEAKALISEVLRVKPKFPLALQMKAALENQ